MLWSLFSSVALAGLVVAGNVPCSFWQEGAILLQSLSSAPVPIPTPLTLATSNGQLVEGNLQYYNFQNCSSIFMHKFPYLGDEGYEVYFGIITLLEDGNTCIGITPGNDLSQQNSITTNPCSWSDDPSQMYQFWQLTATGSVDPLFFVGNPWQPLNGCPTGASATNGVWSPSIECYDPPQTADYMIGFDPVIQ